jgi:hypothetical protein
MWGAYGQNYKGLAIGFRPGAIVGMPGRVQRVKYLDPSNATKEFDAIAKAIADQFNDNTASSDIAPTIVAAAGAAATATALKHQSWAYENEVRLVYAQPRQGPVDALGKAIPMTLLPGGDARPARCLYTPGVQ